KALQAGTSHYLGQNFARAYDVTFLGRDGEQHLAYATSWGASTRLVGGVIMTHGDDHGLRLPPAIAPHQVVLLPLAGGEVATVADKLGEELRADGVRAHLDNRFDHLSFGRRTVDWELKGVPVRVELGPRELAAGQATLVRRDTRDKTPVPIEGVARAARELLDELQRGLLAESTADRERRTYTVTDLDEFRDRIAGGGFFRLAWCGSADCEAALGEGTGATIRVILDGQPPDGPCVVDGAPPAHTVLVARAY
ncbi:MAG TPA: His/Gly/Thr/Pro-type tRNA ligase C-terminal domain-containing protein, partial [Actinomycetes bacterium]